MICGLSYKITQSGNWDESLSPELVDGVEYPGHWLNALTIKGTEESQ